MSRSAIAFAAFLGFICAALGAEPWRYMPLAGDGYDDAPFSAPALAAADEPGAAVGAH
jgi:hypothetical protein